MGGNSLLLNLPPTFSTHSSLSMTNPISLPLSKLLLKPNSSLKPYYSATSRLPTRPVSFSVLATLPTAKPELFASQEKAPKWSDGAIKSFTLAQVESRKFRHGNTQTAHLLLSILTDGTNPAAKFLWDHGITYLKVRDAVGSLKLKSKICDFPAPLSDDAQRALDWAADHKRKSGCNGEITTADVLLGIWSEVESPGHKVLATLGFDNEKAKELESLSAGPGLVHG